MKVKEESEKVGLKLNIQKMKIMASGPITSWEIDEEWKQCQTLFFGGSKITADGDCSHEIKRRLLLGTYAILVFTASDLASITSHVHSWVLFLLWLHPFILSGVISPLISSSILGTY